MSIAEVKKSAEHRMQKSLEALRLDLTKIRTGRAHIGLLDHVQVDYYGSMVPVNTVANITVLDPRTLGVQAWEKGMAAKIEKAIRDSDLGVNPANDGNVIRLVMPQLTEERRKEYIKVTRHKAEEARVAVRNIRRHSIEHVGKLTKDKEISEDDARGAEKQLDAATKKHIDTIDELLKAKEAELLEV